MAEGLFAIETVARDGLGRTSRTKVRAHPFKAPTVLQVVGPEAPADGRPAAVLADAKGGRAPPGALVFAWGPSPLFQDQPTRADGDVLLPRPVPRAFAIGPLIAAEELVRAEGEVAGALASKGGSAHLEPLSKTSSLVALENLVELRGRPREFVQALAGARAALGPRPLLYAPGVAEPASVALIIALGADLVDDYQGLAAAASGVFLYTFGPVAGGLAGACPCAACEAHFEAAEPPGKTAGTVGGRAPGEPAACDDRGEAAHSEPRRSTPRAAPAFAPDTGLFRAALAHNRKAIASEIAAASRAIEQGTLRELVETRVRAQPWLVAAMRNVDREFYETVESLTPIWKRRLHALSHESLNRPEVRRWCERLKARYAPPPSVSVMLLVPCAARKPYSESQTHRAIDRALQGMRPAFAVHRVVVTSPLGVVPEELERVFPAAHYDIPVTGDWAAEESGRVEEQVLHLAKVHAYRAVVSMVGDDLPDLEPRVKGLVECAKKGRRFEEALTSTADALREALKGLSDVDPRRRTVEDLHSIARFQFGAKAADALFEGAEARGRWPWNRVIALGKQLAQHVPDRGRLALTLEGASRVAGAGAYRVTVGDFALKGDIFAVGVTAVDPEVRWGDSVAVLQGGQVVAAGFARMAAAEMLAMRRGVAVDVRHKAGGD